MWDDGLNNENEVFQQGGFSSGHSITTTNNSGLAWVGEKGNGNTWMYKWGNNEETVSIFDDAFVGLNIERTTDGGFIIGTWGGTLLKTDSEFNYDETLFIEEIDLIPETFVLSQNHPNPFNPVTTIRYDLPEDALVNITIYDMMGKHIKTLVNDQQTAGYRFTQWNATNNADSPVSAGIYLYMIQAGEFRQTKKMVLLK